MRWLYHQLSDCPSETLLPHLQNGHDTYLQLMGWQEGTK